MSKSNKYQATKIEPIENVEVNDEGFVVEKATEENQTIKPEREVTKERKRSQIDQIKRFQKWVNDLQDLKMTTKEETEQLKQIAEAMTLRWIGGKLIE